MVRMNSRKFSNLDSRVKRALFRGKWQFRVENEIFENSRNLALVW